MVYLRNARLFQNKYKNVHRYTVRGGERQRKSEREKQREIEKEAEKRKKYDTQRVIYAVRGEERERE